MGHHQLDSLDEQILKLIANDARIPFLEVARVCHVSGAAIHQRIQKLTRLGVLKGSHYVLDPEKIGYDTCAFVGLFLKDPSDFDKVSQLSIQFVLEEQALPEGEYKVDLSGGNGTVKLAKVYLDETRWVWPLEYKEGNISVTHDGEKYRFMLEFRESFDSNYKKYAGVEVIYGGSFSAEFNGTIQYVGTEPGEGPVDPDPEIITEQVDYSLGSTPPEAEYGYSADMGGYYGKIYFARPTPADINTCIYFLNHAENAAETLDPEAGGIEFLPGMSYISFGEGDNEDGEYYRLTEGGIDMSYDSSSGEWTFNFNGIMTNTVTGIQWKIITKYTGPIDGFSSVKPE